MSKLEGPTTSHGASHWRERRMLELCPGADSWELALPKLAILELRYFPGGIQDANLRDMYGNSITRDWLGDRPDWVFFVYNRETENLAALGPVDMRRFFTRDEDIARISALEHQKRLEIRRYRRSAAELYSLASRGFLEANQVEFLRQVLRPNALGDREFPGVKAIYEQAQENFLAEYGVSFQDFTERVWLLRAASRRVAQGGLQLIPPDQMETTRASLAKLQNREMLSPEEREQLAELYSHLEELRNYILGASLHTNGSVHDAGSGIELLHLRAQAMLWVMGWLAEQDRDIRVLDLNPGASQGWRFYRAVLPEAMSARVDNVVDYHPSRTTYALAQNPNRAFGSFFSTGSPIETRGGVFVEEWIHTPHSFNIIVACCCLNNRSPNELRHSFHGYDHFLRITGENGDDTPSYLILVDSPEAMIWQTQYCHLLTEIGGFQEVFSKRPDPNTLSAQAREKLLERTDEATIRRVEAALAQSFEVHVLLKVGPLDETKLQAIADRSFGEWPRTNGRSANGNGVVLPRPVTAEELEIVNACLDLGPDDIQHTGDPVLSIAVLDINPEYREFHERLTALIWISDVFEQDQFLSGEDRRRIAAITHRIDNGQQFFPECDAAFVMERANRHGLSCGLLESTALAHHVKPLAKEIGRAHLKDSLPLGARIFETDSIDPRAVLESALRTKFTEEEFALDIRNRRAAHGRVDTRVRSALTRWDDAVSREEISIWDLYLREQAYREENGERAIIEEQDRPERTRTRVRLRKAVEELHAAGVIVSAIRLSKWMGYASSTPLKALFRRNNLLLSHYLDLAPPGWRPVGAVLAELRQQGIPSTHETILSFARADSPDHADVTQQFASTDGVVRDCIPPDIQTVVIRKFTDRWKLSRPKPGEMTASGLAEELHVDSSSMIERVAKLVAQHEEHDTTRPDYDHKVMINPRLNESVIRVDNYLDPNLVSALVLWYNADEFAPDDYISRDSLARELRVDKETLAARDKKHLIRHPEWGKIFSQRQNRKDAFYYHHDLAEVLREQIARERKVPEVRPGWSTDTGYAKVKGHTKQAVITARKEAFGQDPRLNLKRNYRQLREPGTLKADMYFRDETVGKAIDELLATREAIPANYMTINAASGLAHLGDEAFLEAAHQFPEAAEGGLRIFQVSIHQRWRCVRVDLVEKIRAQRESKD